MKRMFRMVGGTDREGQMARELEKASSLQGPGARVVVQALGLARDNLERFRILVEYVPPDDARDYLRKYDFA